MTPTTSGFATIISLLLFFCSSTRILKYVSQRDKNKCVAGLRMEAASESTSCSADEDWEIGEKGMRSGVLVLSEELPQPKEIISWDRCLCQGSPARENLGRRDLTPLNWPKLVHAASIRQDNTWKFLVEQNATMPEYQVRGFVHVKCYSLYTHKKALAAISKQTPDLKSSSAESDSADDTAATEGASKRPFTRSTHSKILRDVCLFCQTKTKRRRRRAGEKLFGV